MNADPDFPTFARACRQLSVELDESRYNLLVRYVALVREWNQRMNLVSRRDTDRLMTYHVLDSLAVLQLVPVGAHVTDVGTGAGLPGIPLAIVRPDLRVSLVESSGKRCSFLDAAVAALGLSGVTIFNHRAESLPPLFSNVIVSRLSGPMAETIRVVARHRDTKGLIVLYKTRAVQPEIVKAGRVLGRERLRVVRSLDITLPFTAITRRLVVLGPS